MFLLFLGWWLGAPSSWASGKVAMMPSYTQNPAYGTIGINQSIEVWGRAWGGAAPYSYTLTFGDGTTNTGSNISEAQMSFYVGASHVYASSGSKTAVLTVTDATNGVLSASAIIRVLPAPTHADRVNMAIERGKLYLYKNYTSWDANRVYWHNTSDNYGFGATGFALLAFEENGHLPGNDWQQDIYAQVVQRGLNTLASQAVSKSMTGHASLDTDGDGVAINIGTDTYADCITANAFIMAFTSTNAAKNAFVPAGMGPFAGASYYSFVLNMIEALYATQHADGSWHYSVDPTNPDTGADGSTHQWPNIVMLTAQERWGLPILPNVITASMSAFVSLQSADGACGYSAAGVWENDAKTGGMLGGFTLGNKFAGDNNVNRGLTFLGNNWNNVPQPYSGTVGGWAGDFYAMYGVKKGLQLQTVTSVTAPDGAHDWYQDMSSWLLGDATLLGANVAPGYRTTSNAFGQNNDGSWTGSQGYISTASEGAGMTTASAMLVLTKAVTKPMPVAAIVAISDQSSRMPAPFTLDGSGSYHMDPNSAIVEYLWIVGTTNLDWANPTASGKTASVNPGWTVPGSYPVTLRVKDNNSPANYATATATVIVSDTDVAPVAVAVPPTHLPAIYAGKVGATIYLDGSASYDPDGDTITNYLWDLNGDGLYGTAADAQLDTSGNNARGVTASLTYAVTYSGQIGLQVTANGKSSSNGAAVDIYAAPSDLAVNSISASNIVPLVSATVTAVFTNDAGSGQALNNVLVRFFNGNPFTSGTPLGSNYTVNLPVGGSASITANLTLNGATNVYAYLDANNAVPEWNESNNVAWVDVSTANKPPVVSNPIGAQAGTYGVAFSLSCPTNTFTDPDDDALSYSATGLPPGIVFDPSTLSFSGTPTAAGSFQVLLVADDGKTPPLTVTNTIAFTVAKAAASISLAGLSQSYVSAPRNASASTTPDGLSVQWSYNESSTAPSDAGSYAVVATISDPNYQGSATDVLVVAKAPLTVRANNQTRTYGQSNPSLTMSYAGFLGGDGPSLLSVLPLASTAANPASPCGDYPITVSAGVSSNYDISCSGGTMTVTKAPLVMVGDSFSRAYGQANPVFTARITGVMNGEDISARFSTTATAQSIPGNYRITLNVNDPEGKLGNYQATLTSGMLSVTNALLIGQVLDQTRVYGQTNPVFTLTYSGFVNGQTSNVLTGALLLTCLDTNGVVVGTNSPAGQYPITISSGQSAPYYTLAYQEGTLNVTQAVLQVTAGDATRVYGTANPAFSAAIAGFVNGEDTNVLSGTLSLTTPALLNSSVGSYPIVPSGLSAANYTIVPQNGALTITRADLVVSVDSPSRAYGRPNPSLSGALNGVAVGDNLSATFATAAVSASPVGAYDILPVWSDPDNRLGNYSVSTNRGTLTILRAALVVSADNQTKVYGQPNPPLTGSLAGIENGDNLTAAFTTAATASSAIGTYNIVPWISDPANVLGNYLVVTNTGFLTNTAAALLVNVDSKTRTYGDPNPDFTGTLGGLVNSDAITVGFTSAATPASPVGSYAIVPVFEDPADRLGNYSITTNGGSLSITRALLTVTAQNQTRAYGLANPPLTFGYAGFRNGDGSALLTQAPLAASSAAPSSWPGPYPITLSGGVSSNYNFSLVGAMLTVTKASLLVNGDDASRAYGRTNPVFTATMTGVAAGDGISFNLITAADTNSLPGPYDINILLDDPNNRLGAYDVTLLSGILTITNAVLTGQVASQVRVYGATNAPFAVSYSGFVNGDQSNVLSGPLQFSCFDSQGAPVRTNTTAGQYAIHATGQTATNYSVVYADGTLTVTQAVLTVSADNATRVYGQNNPAFSASYSGFVNNENAGVVNGQPVLTTTADATSPVGGYDLEPALGSLQALNYSFAFSRGSLTVTKANLLVSADDQSRAYGAPDPQLTASYHGFVNGDSAGTALGGTPSLACNDSDSSPVGAYPITAGPGTLSAGNYSLSFTDGVMTITKARLTATADNQTRSYGSTNPPLTLTYTGFASGETSLLLSALPVADTSATTNSPVGTYPITLSGGASSNYDISLVGGTLAVTQAVLLARADDQARGYGATNPPLSVSYTGLVNGDGAGVLQSPPRASTLATESSPAGSYAITLTGGLDSNYRISLTDGTLTVSPATLTVSADPQNRLVGAINPVLTATLTGFVNGDDTNVVSGHPLLTTAADAASPVGTYDIVVDLGDLSATNYAFVPTNGVLTVGKALLMVSANDQTRQYGTANPVLTYSYSGFIEGDDAAVLSGAPALSSTADSTSRAGSYPISISRGSLASTNYALCFTNGTLSVTRAPLTISIDNQSRGYGAAAPVLTGHLTGLLNADNVQFTLSSSATMSSPVGRYDITPGFSDPEGCLDNYSIVTNKGSLLVTPVSLVIRADDQSRRYGAANPVLTGTVQGLVNNDPISVTFSTAAVAASPIGNYAIFPVFADPAGKLANYSISTTAGTLAIGKAPLAVTAYSTSRPYGTANPSFVGTIVGLVNNDSIRVWYSSGATLLSPAGRYPIGAALDDPSGVSSNYDVTFVNGTLNITAALTLTDLPLVYVVGEGPQLLDTNAVVADGGGLNFGGASLQVRVATNAMPEDQLSIQLAAGGTGGVGVVPPNVTFGGVAVGSFAGGTGTNALVFSFNDNATSTALSAVLRELTFTTTATNPALRDVQVTLTYNGVSLTADRVIELNRLPVAGCTTVQVAQGVPVGIPFSLVLSNAFDPDGGTLSVVGADRASTNGAQITLTDTNFLYVPPVNQSARDSFTYVILDGMGGHAVGTVLVLVQKCGLLGIDGAGIHNSGARLSMMGTPGHVYQVLVSDDLFQWTLLRVATAAPTGLLEILDSDSKVHSSRFYRAVEQ